MKFVQILIKTTAIFFLSISSIYAENDFINTLRPSAYPLISIDPFTSAWSRTDNLADSSVTHWTGKDFPLLGIIEVDGKPYRFMGATNDARFAEKALQTSVNVQATRTIYSFNCGGKISLKLVFAAPLMLDNLELLSRPVNYISYEVESSDGCKHDVRVYIEAAPNWALNTPEQKSRAAVSKEAGLSIAKIGSVDQKILGRKGDNVRIDWGWFCLASNKDTASVAAASPEKLRDIFLSHKPFETDSQFVDNGSVAICDNLGSVNSAQSFAMLGYDDVYSIRYFGKNLRPYWNRSGQKTIESALASAAGEFDSLMRECRRFDKSLYSEAMRAGGEKYAQLCAVAYRQAISAHKLVLAPNGNLMFFSKENFSNGSIGTVDVTYPSIPLFLRYNPELVKALVNFIFDYSESGRWGKPFPAHDVGTYPIAEGQTYTKDMPVEEAGNMLIICAAIANAEGNAEYAKLHWNALSAWADYLVQFGLDPAEQLCTDDFAGHFAHNANLSVKAILGIASYAKLASMLGLDGISKKYFYIAKNMAEKWEKMANDGDHYKLTFDKPGTWSQKYNMVWDRLLGLDIFPQKIIGKEIAYYLKKQNIYGLPLDNRQTYSKSDWIIWTATLAGNKNTFEKFVEPLWKFYNETVDRVPMSDWYFTDKPKYRGFIARSVVGGYFIKLLDK